MSYVTPAQPVAEALYAIFQDATLQALVAGGVQSDVPESPTFPFLWFEILERAQYGGMGTKPGVHTLPELEVRLHLFSQFQGMAELQGILSRAIALLADPPASVTGYSAWGIFHDSTTPLPAQILNGIKVNELVSVHRLYVEAA